MLVEACVTSLSEARAAAAAGAHRLEVCSGLEVGGLTPDPDVLRSIKDCCDVPAFAMVRPRAGAFTATRDEMAQMAGEMRALASAGADGFVFGVLKQGHKIDTRAVRLLADVASALPVTFHRAFDQVSDPLRALDFLISAGVARILTSGGAANAWEGRDVLRTLVKASPPNMAIIAAGSVREDHVVELIRETGVGELHARASAIPGVVTAMRKVSTLA